VLEPGSFFETHYVIDGLGVGGMSSVHLGFDCRTFQFVAIKTLLERFSNSDTVIGRMRREAEIYRRLNHKNIVGFVHADEFEGGYYIVQEYLRGDPLRALMEAFPDGMPFQAALQILTDLAGALGLAHGQGIVHRDVQPDNVIIDYQGMAKIFDFGIAYADDELLVTDEGTIMGTVLYSSPEQNMGQEVDERADIYSLGAILFEMLTGRRLNPGRTVEEALEFQLRAAPDMRALNPEIPEGLERITRKLLEPDADRRYWTVRDLLVDLGTLRVEASLEELDKLYGHPFFRRLREAQALFGEGRTSEALTIGLDLGRRYREYQIDDLSKVYYLLGRSHARSGKTDLAVRYFDKALFADPGNVDYAIDFAIELVREKRTARALKLVEQVRQHLPNNLLARGLAELLMRDGGIPQFDECHDRSWLRRFVSRFLPGRR